MYTLYLFQCVPQDPMVPHAMRRVETVLTETSVTMLLGHV